MESGDEKKPLIPVRIVQCLLMFLGVVITYAQRVNVVISIVAMTDRNATDTDAAVYPWDEGIKSYILSSFFWGYTVTQIPGGYFAQKYGSKYPIGIALGICSALAFLTPLSAKIGDWYLVVALRTLQGLCQGVLYPSIHLFIAKWAPSDERGTLVGFVYSGVSLGTVIALATGGYIAASPLGWPFNFYLTGGLGVIWAVFWFLFSASSPATHKSITSREKEYISGGTEEHSTTGGPPPKVPYGKIFTSCPFYAGIVQFACGTYGAMTTATQTPTYINSILKFNIKSNGTLSALPYISYFCFCYIFMYVNDLITRKKWLSVNALRKSFNTFSQTLPAFSLLAVGFLTSVEHRNWAIFLFVLVSTSKAAFLYGSHVNPIDLSPNFAGTIMSIWGFSSNVVSLLTPLSVGVIVTDETNPAHWRTIFFIGATLYITGGMIFLIFGRTDIQPWNNPQ